nr:uncharacterized protein LOC129268718 [Lytechinus pictus]
MPGMIRSALNRSLRTGSESSGGELSPLIPVNHVAEWKERLERSFQDDEDGSLVNRQSNSPVRMLAAKPKERDMYDSSPNYSPLPG